MLRLLLEGALGLLWPPRTTCVLCEGALGGPVEGVPVCSGCWDAMAFAPGLTRCTNCNRPVAGGRGLCVDCAAAPPFGRVWAVGLHHGPLREAIHHLKFNGRKALGAPLGRRLAAQVQERPELVVPLPLHPTRLRERGYNQAALIARGLAGALGVPVGEGALVRLRSTARQAKLDREDRLRNLSGAFGAHMQASPPWAGRAVLLVDDVLTTGATASAAAAVLRETGARRVDLAVLAVSDLRVAGAGTVTP